MENNETIKAGGQSQPVAAKVHTCRWKEPYHFDRRLTNDDIRRGKVMIPSKFLAEVGEELHRVVNLRVLSHKEFEVAVKRGEGGVYLGQGFNEFVRQYNIKPRYFLLFGSSSASLLSVVILLGNRCEDNYNRIVQGYTINNDLCIPAKDAYGKQIAFASPQTYDDQTQNLSREPSNAIVTHSSESEDDDIKSTFYVIVPRPPPDTKPDELVIGTDLHNMGVSGILKSRNKTGSRNNSSSPCQNLLPTSSAGKVRPSEVLNGVSKVQDVTESVERRTVVFNEILMMSLDLEARMDKLERRFATIKAAKSGGVGSSYLS